MDYDSETYDAAAGALVGIVVEALADKANLSALTGVDASNLFNCMLDIQAELDTENSTRELVCRTRVLLGPEGCKFDKGAFGKLVREHPHNEWPALKVAKRALAIA